MKPSNPTPWKFIILMAVLMSFIAFAIDAMIPALEQIGQDLKVKNLNDVQLVISTIFLGMSIGMLFFGPFSDSFGRKPAMYLGAIFFVSGCVVSIFATNFTIMIVGRLMQGMGGAAFRIVTVAMVRDKFSGNEMAKIMSLMVMIFILVPVVAPLVGQIVLLAANWQAIFWLMLVLALVTTIWLALGQDETLAENKRLDFSLKAIIAGINETLANKISLGYTIASGLVFSALIAYLSLAQQILQNQYQLGNKFVIVFGSLAIFIGLASFANAKWLDKYKIETICKYAIGAAVILSIIFVPISFVSHWHPSLAILLIFIGISFFCFGLLFSNLATLAISPLGHIAGIANSVITSVSLLIAVLLGGLVAYFYDGTIMSLSIGFLIVEFFALILIIKLGP